MNEINLIPANKRDYAIICNLARFYAYDISEFYGDEPGWEMEENGLYGIGIDYNKYFDDQNAWPYLIRYKNQLAGFAIVDKNSIDPTAEFNMAQFFILRTYKRKGIGKYCAQYFFEKFKGIWEINVLPKNKTAYQFWKSIISKYTNNNFREKILKNKNGEERITFLFSTDSNN